MRKWLFFLLAIAVVYLISKINTRGAREKSPFLKRLNWMISALVWVLTVVFTLSFLYWLYTQIFL